MWRFSLAVALVTASVSTLAAEVVYSAAEEWIVTKHEIDGRVAAVRINAALPALATKQEFGRSLKFTVPFNVHNDKPFPERYDREGLEKVEEAIESRLVETNAGVFATIITTNNAREYLLYVSETAQAQSIAERLVADIHHHKISFRLDSDPDWEAWSRYARVHAPGQKRP